ncbi:MAG: phage holin family protein [Solirubrobacteraceae bacterium]
MSETPSASSGRPRPEQPQNIATTVAEVSERASLLIREEVELAKAEVTEKAVKLARGAVVGVVAGVFFLTALVLALVGCAWLIYYLLPGGDFTYFWGFFAMAVILVLLGIIAGLIAARVVKRSAPPVPTMAIEEAQLIRETVSAGAGPHTDAAGEAAPAPAPVSAPAPAASATAPAASAPEPAASAPEPAASAPEPAAEEKG